MTPNIERFHPPYRIAALARLSAADGIPVQAILCGTGLDAAALDDVMCRTSIEQYLVACANALRWSNDPALPFRVGTHLRTSDHGLYGLMLMSCASVREVFRLAVTYQLLAAPIAAVDVVESATDVRWVMNGASLNDVPVALRSFVIEQQFAQQIAHLEQVLGTPCPPMLACFAHPAPPHHALYAELLHCRCVFDRPRYEILYPKDVLARRPSLANPLAAKALQNACDGLVADIEASLGFAGRVYRALRGLGDPGARMKVVASAMKMTDRTLRRRLADEGTCFSTISHRVKYAVATQHLKTSSARIDEIASITGFSDSSNFRRAFIRWTSMSPARFRRSQQAATPNGEAWSARS